MNEYIEKEEILTYLEPLTNTPAIDIKLHIQGMKTADVQPIRHGRWINDGDCMLCSCCNYAYNSWFMGSNYCPNCGARMDGDTE